MICGALEAFCSQGLYLLWLKHYDGVFTQTQINTYPLGVQAVGIVSNLGAAVYIDASGRRAPMGILACALQLVSAVVLIVPGVPFGATMFAFYLAGTSYIVNPLLFGWANVIMQRGGDDALRSVVLAAMNAASQILYTWWGIVLYPASDAPYWRKGCIGMFVVIFFLLSMLGVVSWVRFRRFGLSLCRLQLHGGEIRVPGLTEEQIDDRTAAKYPDAPVVLQGDGSSVNEMKKESSNVDEKEVDCGDDGAVAKNA